MTEITSDPITWPSGDRIWLICHAIAMAEGANVEGSNPDRLNNPGDISDGSHEFEYEEHSGSRVTHFPDKVTGWKWLYDKISNIVDGHSSVYSSAETWTSFAHKWAGDWENWLKNVTSILDVSPDSFVNDYLK